MSKLFVAVFANQAATNVGLQALHKPNAQGETTVYATGVIAKDSGGGKLSQAWQLTQEALGA